MMLKSILQVQIITLVSKLKKKQEKGLQETTLIFCTLASVKSRHSLGRKPLLTYLHSASVISKYNISIKNIQCFLIFPLGFMLYLFESCSYSVLNVKHYVA